MFPFWAEIDLLNFVQSLGLVAAVGVYATSFFLCLR